MLKRLAKCIREYKKQTIATPILVTLEVIMEVLMPLIMAQLINKGIVFPVSQQVGVHLPILSRPLLRMKKV